MKTHKSATFRSVFPAACVLISLFFHSSSLRGQTVDWQIDLGQATALAKEQNKLVLLHFSASWCHPCKTLETFVFSNSQVQRSMAENVIAVKIDVDEFPEIVKEYGVAGVPFDVAITPNGRIVSRRSSPLEAAGYDDMIQSLSKTIQVLTSGKDSPLNQNLDELKHKIYSDNHVAEHPPLAPVRPSHLGADPSFESQELKRNSQFVTAEPRGTANAKLVISNPYLSSNNANAALKPADVPPSSAKIGSQRIYNENFLKSDLPVKATSNSTVAANQSAQENAPAAAAQPVRSLNNLVIAGKAKINPTGTGNASPPANPKPEFALHGKCPVTLLKEGRWTDGDPQWGCVHRNRTYLFASAVNLQEFQNDPDGFSPLLAGYDPVIFDRSGEMVAGAEEHGVFMGKTPNQRIVLFANQETRAEFQSNPRKYIETIRQAMQSSGGSSSTILR